MVCASVHVRMKEGQRTACLLVAIVGGGGTPQFMALTARDNRSHIRRCTCAQLTAGVNSDGSTSSSSVGARGDSVTPAAGPSPGGSSTGDCTDIAPSSTYTCQQQVNSHSQ